MTLTISDVRVFDGERVLDGPHDVTVEGVTITALEPSGAASPDGGERVDGAGLTLLPGLVDAHVHLHGVDLLETLARWGVTPARPP